MKNLATLKPSKFYHTKSQAIAGKNFSEPASLVGYKNLNPHQ